MTTLKSNTLLTLCALAMFNACLGRDTLISVTEPHQYGDFWLQVPETFGLGSDTVTLSCGVRISYVWGAFRGCTRTGTDARCNIH